MKRALVAILAGCVALGFTSIAAAGNNSQAGIAVHLGPEQTVLKNICDLPGPSGLTDASAVVATEGSCSGLYSVYLLVCNGSHRNAEVIAQVGGDGFDIDGTGVGGAEFSIQYGPNLNAYNWILCADQEFLQATWPLSGSGGTLAYNTAGNCQGVPSPSTAPNEVIALLGVLQVELLGPDALSIQPYVSGDANVIDCGSFNDVVSGNVPPQLGTGGFCNPGYSPCGTITPVEETTWGAIKKQFD